jgi:hypothetical protein
LLQLAISDTPLQVNLTSPQNLDWIHWGRISATTPDRKAGITPLISDYTPLNTQPRANSGATVTFSWTDGIHPPIVSEANEDVSTFDANGGFQITVPADTTVKTLNLYTEVFFGQAQLQATLSDGSAAAITDQSVNDPDAASKIYSIDFRAASAGQALTVTFSAVSGGVGLQAATLTPHLPVVIVASPTAGQSFTPADIVPLSANAGQFDNSISDVSFNAGGLVLDVANSPFNASLGPLSPGHYSVAALAADSTGLTNTSAPVEFDVIGQGGTLSVQTADAPSTIDLAAQGTADWILWGPVNTGDFIINNPGNVLARKTGVEEQLSTYWPIGSHPIRASAFANSLSFSDLSQIFNSSGSQVQAHGQNDGYEITAPADTTARTLQLYAGAISARARLTAFLSDGSSATVGDISFDDPSGPDFSGFGATTVYTINYSAASAGQTLTVRYTLDHDYGTGEIDLMGAALAGPAVTPVAPPPQIGSLDPSIGQPNTKVTLTGTNFGAIQGDGHVLFRQIAAQVITWSDTSIVVFAPGALQPGSVVQVVVVNGQGTSNQVSFSIPSFKVFPPNLNMVVGQSQTLRAKDSNGTPVTGLQWSTSDSTIVNVSSDDTPTVTALAPGTVTVYAGDVPVPVTVYVGASLPPGTPIWSLSLGGGSGVASLVPAVPSDSGVDVFALDATGTLSAATTDGEIAWSVAGIPQRATTWASGATTVEPSTITPDFSGSVLVTSPYIYSQEQGCITHFTHKVSQVNASNGQMLDLHTFSDQRMPGITSGCPSDAGFYADNNTIEVVIPHPSGPVFIQDNATITEVDPLTAQTIASAALDSSTVDGVPFFDPIPAFMGKMIVAGDGNAYVPYLYTETTQSNNGSGSQATHTLSHLMLLRMSPDGTSAKTELKNWTADSTSERWMPPDADPLSCSNCSHSSSKGSFVEILPEAAITDADTGVTVFASYGASCSESYHADYSVDSGDGVHRIPKTYDQFTQCPDNNKLFVLMTSASHDSVTSQVDGIALMEFAPALQREDGSYIGSYTGIGHETNRLITISRDGSVLWQTIVGPARTDTSDAIPVTPLYATADGGAIVTSTKTTITHYDPLNPGSGYQDFTTRVITTKLGTLYTIDKDGNIISQEPDTGAIYSWKEQWYVRSPEISPSTSLLGADQEEDLMTLSSDIQALYSWASYAPPTLTTTISQVVMPQIYFAPTFAAIQKGSPSMADVAIQRIQVKLHTFQIIKEPKANGCGRNINISGKTIDFAGMIKRAQGIWSEDTKGEISLLWDEKIGSKCACAKSPDCFPKDQENLSDVLDSTGNTADFWIQTSDFLDAFPNRKGINVVQVEKLDTGFFGRLLKTPDPANILNFLDFRISPTNIIVLPIVTAEVLKHEIGHAFTLEHIEDSANLMCGKLGNEIISLNSCSAKASTKLDPDQVKRAKAYALKLVEK